MNSKQPPIRPKGQRSIPSTYIFRRSNDLVKEPEIKTTNQKDNRISLSDFLNKKLNGCSAFSASIQGKAQPFSSPVADQLVDKDNKDVTGEKVRGEGDLSASLALVVVLEKFKKTESQVKGNIHLRESEDRSLTTDDANRSRKRKQGDVTSQPSRTVLAVLGGDAGADRRAKARKIGVEKKPRPLYNHYSNGGGWWDCDMEGVDNEEVGCNDVWEGMGTTNLGGLDWN